MGIGKNAARLGVFIVLVRAIDAVPNSPNYYNASEGWNNDGKKLDFCNRVDIIKEDLRRENLSVDDAKHRQQTQTTAAVVRNGSKEIGSIILGIIVRALSLGQLAGLPFDVCYFDEQVKRSLCAEVMKFVEPVSHRKLIQMKHMETLFKRHDYGCKPISIHGFDYSRIMFTCPFKIMFAHSLAWYIDGFHLLQSKSTKNRVYIFRTLKSYVGDSPIPMAMPIGEINNIHLEKGSRFGDISRILFG